MGRRYRHDPEGFYSMTKPALKKMLRQKKGSVVSIASVAGLWAARGRRTTHPGEGGSHRRQARTAVASEVAKKGIHGSMSWPRDFLETDMIRDAPVEMIKHVMPMGVGKARGVAAAVRFLCSDRATYITGQVIGVNSGMICSSPAREESSTVFQENNDKQNSFAARAVPAILSLSLLAWGDGWGGDSLDGP